MSSCCDIKEDIKILNKPDKILIMGSPNVGKSVFFSYFTGINVVSSNFAGTTVTYTEGKITLGEGQKAETFSLIDVPGTYSMQAVSQAEAVAVKFMESNPLAVICVLNATSLERGVKLALELKGYNIPTVYCLNMMDVSERQGFKIDIELLERELGGKVIPTVAVKAQNFDLLKEELHKIIPAKEKRALAKNAVPVQSASPDSKTQHAVAKAASDTPAKDGKSQKGTEKRAGDKDGGITGGAVFCTSCKDCPSANCGTVVTNTVYWDEATEIVNKVRTRDRAQMRFIDKLGEASIKPWPGIPIFLAVLLLSLAIVVFGGKGLRAAVLLPIVNNAIVPFFNWLFSAFVPEGVVLNVLVGNYGIFKIAFEWIIALILPYVFLFYVVFSFLEDSGYLPRAAVLFDNIMRKIGVQGGSLITIVMGFGCSVPAIIGTRTATTKKERLIITTIICFAIPCISQTGALISLMAEYSVLLLVLLALLAFGILFLVSIITSKLLKGKVDPLAIELPNLLMPNGRSYRKKLLIRMKHFLLEAELPMLISIVIAALLAETGALDVVADIAAPIVVNWLGMPKEAVIALILGVIRREMTLMPLLALNLTSLQMFVGATIGLLYLPCLSVFAVLTKEFNTRTAIAIALSTFVSAFLVGGLINQIAHLFM